MKKIISFVAVALAAFAMSSCAKSDSEAAQEATMTLSVSLPDAVGTKAYGDGMYAEKTVVVGVFDEAGNEQFRKSYTWGVEEFSKELQLRFVMGRSYQMVIFAQYGEAYGKLPVPVKEGSTFLGWVDEYLAINVVFDRMQKYITPTMYTQAERQLDEWMG